MKHILTILILLGFMSVASAEAWTHNNTVIPDSCLTTPLASGDYYESYYDHYVGIPVASSHWEDENFMKFLFNIGLYIGKEIPINDSYETFWYETVSVTKDLSNCMNNPSNMHMDGYNINKTLDVKLCDELAPNINEKCSSIVQITHTSNSRIPFYYETIYGLYEMDDKVLIIPLQNIER